MHSSESACGADTANGCSWVDADDGVQKCDFEVPAFGFGVVEDAPATLQSFGAVFDLTDPALADPTPQRWVVKSTQGVDATIKPVRIVGLDWKTDGKLQLSQKLL